MALFLLHALSGVSQWYLGRFPARWAGSHKAEKLWCQACHPGDCFGQDHPNTQNMYPP
jgi:hypothetical protein